MFFKKSSFCVWLPRLLGRINVPQCQIMMSNNDKFCLQGKIWRKLCGLYLSGTIKEGIMFNWAFMDSTSSPLLYYFTGNTVRLGWTCFGWCLGPSKDCSRVHSVQLKLEASKHTNSKKCNLTLGYLWTKTGTQASFSSSVIGRITELTWITFDTLCTRFF